MTYLWIALGAVVGASARYFLSGYVARNFSSTFPYGTLIINITGSMLLGFFLIWTEERVLVDPRWRWLLAVGFCGSYTTFSSYAFESFAFMEQGQWVAKRCRQQPTVPWIGRCRGRLGKVVVKWRPLWRYKSRCT